jgi:methyl-accepting chemotaxis protein
MIDALQKFNIGVRLGVSFSVLILLMVALCGVGAMTARSLRQDLSTTARVDVPLMLAVADLQERTQTVARSSRELLIVDTGGQIRRLRAGIEESLNNADIQIAEIHKLAGDGENTHDIRSDPTLKFVQSVSVY